jgi:glutamate-1-semialdehyde 2,1-aminomutase
VSTAPARPSRAIDQGLRERARRVIPNGMYGHLDTSRFTDAYPQFLARGGLSR